MRYCQVLFQQKVGPSETLTYSLPANLDVEIGSLINVPLKRKEKTGLIVDIHSNKPNFRTLNVISKVDSSPLLNENQIELAKWISKYYFCPLFKVIKLFIPKRVFNNEPIKRKTKKARDEQIIRSKEKDLTSQQQKIIEEVESSQKRQFLVQGVTGSGKTEIYLQIAKKYIDQEKQILILVPEISLTPQMIEYFEKGTGHIASTFHSKLSLSERLNAWNNVHQNKSKLIIGSRSAIFAPFQSLGAIIVDEEHENSYKQDSSPRYSVHQVAKKMQDLNDQLKVVFGSATPSVETAVKLKDSTFKIEKRINSTPLPQIEIVDLREEFHKKNKSIFSERLQQELNKILEQKKQAILFLNRRGSASSVTCRDCGYTEQCQDCETPLTYHARTLSNPKLICHHCGNINNPPSKCKECQGHNIKFLGIGTQRIEQEIRTVFPNARTLRADKDTTSTKNGFKEIYAAFRNHEADILVGTQMIAKGLHLPKVELVGVVLADIGLNIPDYRTSENAFQLLTQVSGRSGRSKTQGKVIIQTYTPENIALKFAQEQNFDKFLNYERRQRALLKNPPFSKLAKITVVQSTFEASQKKTEEIERKLWQIARESNQAHNIEISTYPAYLMRLRNKYRYIALIKNTENLSLSELLEKLPNEYIMDPNVKIDIDPIYIN